MLFVPDEDIQVHNTSLYYLIANSLAKTATLHVLT